MVIQRFRIPANSELLVARSDPQYVVGSTVTTRNFTVSAFPTYVVVEMDPDTTMPPNPPLAACAPPSKISQKDSPASAMLADPSGVLKADNRGSEMFDVSKGIPTTEKLYGNLFGKGYLAEDGSQ